MISYLSYAFIIITFLIAAFILYRGWPYAYIGFSEAQNDNMLAMNNFVRLLREAKTKMNIYDDGNKMEKGLYDDEDLIEEVKKKLASDGNFVIECIFNTDDSTLFREEFQNHSQVKIVKRPERNFDLAHYKIIDNGKKAYLSWHDLGDTTRIIRMYDFSTVRKWPWQKDVKKEYLGDYLRDIEKHFSAQSASEEWG